MGISILNCCFFSDSKIDEMSRKERKKQRRMFKNNYEVAAQAKVLWNKLRQ